MSVENVRWLTRYGPEGPSSRYRVLQYLPLLEAHGWRSHVEPLGLPIGYGAGTKSQVRPLLRRLMRVVSTRPARAGHTLVVQKELLPGAPPSFERVMARFLRRNLAIWDVDDAVWAVSERRAALARTQARYSACVVAGNATIAAWAQGMGAQHVHVIPTCLPVPHETPKIGAGDVVRIGWIGSPATAPQLEQVGDALTRLHRARPAIEFWVMGGSLPNQLKGQSWCRSFNWTSDAERVFLGGLDIGIAPLRRGPIEDAKCGLKVLQYMANGVVPVATDNDTHRRIIGATGVLVADRDWSPLLELVDDASIRRSLGIAAHARARAEYDVSVGAALWDEVLRGGCRR